IQVIKECGKCNIGIQIPLARIPKTVENIRNDINRALEALQTGKNFFILTNATGREAAISCVNTLIDAFEILHCIGRDDLIDEVMILLEESGQYKEYRALKGKILEFEGKLEEAAAQYENIITSYPEDEVAYWLLEKVLFYLGKFEEAGKICEKLLRVSENESEVMFQLIDIYTRMSDFPRLAQTYESCLAKYSGLAQDKNFVENYKQACRNAGVVPRLEI
ncbi:MAG: hypothetical protein PHV59_10725, partial [Victivallales bacterium]|nr:hypothetical protein [Victivallales bacterium]